jgi:DNA-binding GntR family transcriptional regulator
MRTTFQKPKLLKNWAYETIKSWILNHEIKPHQQLKVETLSEKMKVSRTPIRGALLKLESDGLISTLPQVGFFVKGITIDDLIELFELREITESYAAEKAASVISKDELSELRNMQSESIKAFKRGNLKRFNEMEIEMHKFIIRHSGNNRLIKLVEGLKDLTYRERLIALESRENVEESIIEHQRIVDALIEQDEKLAGRMMRRHIECVKKRVINHLKQRLEE